MPVAVQQQQSWTNTASTPNGLNFFKKKFNLKNNQHTNNNNKIFHESYLLLHVLKEKKNFRS